MSYNRAMYVMSVDFDRLLLSLVNSMGLRIRRAVVIEDDGPLYYDGPVEMTWDGGDEGFKVFTAELAGEVLPRDIDSWQMKMWPRGRFLSLSEGGCYCVQVYDTLKEVSE